MNGSAVNKRPRQERALARLITKVDFWSEFDPLDKLVEVDGKQVNPAMKLAMTHRDLDNLAKKGIK